MSQNVTNPQPLRGSFETFCKYTCGADSFFSLRFPAPCDLTSAAMPSKQICVIEVKIQIWMSHGVENASEENDMKPSMETN